MGLENILQYKALLGLVSYPVNHVRIGHPFHGVKVDVASHVGNRLNDNASNCRMLQVKLNNRHYFVYVDGPAL